MLSNITDYIENIINNAGIFAPLIACFLIIIESILPILPLFVFITVNFIFYGKIIGFIISWIFTCIGCFISYYLVKKGFRFKKRPNNAEFVSSLDKYILYIKNLSMTKLSMIIAIPFTPAFLINIAAGITNMDFKKFCISILIGKIFMVYFWGFIGLSLVESFKNPKVLVEVIIMVIIAYILSYVVSKVTDKNSTKKSKI